MAEEFFFYYNHTENTTYSFILTLTTSRILYVNCVTILTININIPLTLFYLHYLQYQSIKQSKYHITCKRKEKITWKLLTVTEDRRAEKVSGVGKG